MKKRIFTFLLFAIGVVFVTNAQVEEQLKKHVYYLASKELKGRKAQTPYAEKAFDYIKTDLEAYGLVCKDFFIDADSMKTISEEIDYSGKYHTLYTVIESNKENKTDEYLIITADYSGKGVDTVQGYELIKYSANSTASSVAIAMELAKIFKTESQNLKRGIIVLFCENDNTTPFADYLNKEYNNIILGFDLANLGYQEKDSLGNYDEEAYNIDYQLSTRVKKATQIVNALVLNNLEINSEVYLNYSDPNSKIPFNFISNNNYLYQYEDVADSLDYVMMDKLTTQIQQVITAFDNANLKIEDYQEKMETSENEQPWLVSAFNNQYKHKSYFGIHLMPCGSNQHKYSEGTMTGKNSFAFSAGVFYRWQFAGCWALQLDANYEYLTAKRHEGNYSANVLSFPLSLVLTTGGRAAMGLDISVGAHYDYMLSGELEGKEISFDYFKRKKWGWHFGFSFRFARLIFGAYYKMPLGSVNTEEYRLSKYMNNIKESTSYFKLGWRF